VTDTLRADRLHCYGNPGAFSPRIDALASEGVLYTDAVSSAPWTIPAHASLFTGLLPSSHKADCELARLDDSFLTLAEILSGAGYQTAAFYSNPWLKASTTNLMQGFNFVDEIPIGKKTFTSRSGDRGGSETYERIVRWMDRRLDRDRPFFLFVNFLETHLPYDPTDEYRLKYLDEKERPYVLPVQAANLFNAKGIPFAEKDFELFKKLYDGCVNYLDGLVGRLLNRLKNKDLYEDSVIVLVSDHGECLGEHGLLGHQFCLYETLLRIPLIIRYPAKDFKGGRRIDLPVQITDIFPTVLDLTGVHPTLPYPIQGRSLAREKTTIPGERIRVAEYGRPCPSFLWNLVQLNPKFDPSVYNKRLKAAYEGKLKAILSERGEEELYDLAADPAEQRNLAGREEKEFATLRVLLSEAFRSEGTPPSGPELSGLDEKIKKELSTLGYIQ
jgi:arylsulfatase A-like enzyme